MEKTDFVFLKDDIFSFGIAKQKTKYGSKGDLVRIIHRSAHVLIVEAKDGSRFSVEDKFTTAEQVVVTAPKPKPVAKEYVRAVFDEPPPTPKPKPKPIEVPKPKAPAKPAKPVKPKLPQQGKLF